MFDVCLRDRDVLAEVGISIRCADVLESEWIKKQSALPKVSSAKFSAYSVWMV